MAASPHHIGTLREGPLHAALKQWSATEGDRLEAQVAGYVIDVVQKDLLIEVQTGGFTKMKRKLRALLGEGYRVRVVFPIAVRKSIVKVDSGGEILGRRRSPKRGSPLDIFGELVAIPDLVTHSGLEIRLVLTVEDEYRKHDPEKAWRRRGWVVIERRLVEIVDVVDIAGPADLAALLPEGLPVPFTTSDLAAGAACSRRLAQQMAYCLRHAGAIAAVGKQGNAVEYQPVS